MEDKTYYTNLMAALDEAVKNSIHGVADIGRLNDLLIETSKRLKAVMPKKNENQKIKRG